MGCGRSRSVSAKGTIGATSNLPSPPDGAKDSPSCECPVDSLVGASVQDQQRSDAEQIQKDGSIISRLEEIVQTAMITCQDRSRVQLFDAERILMDAIDAIDVNNPVGRNERIAALDKLRASQSYQDVLSRLRHFEEVVKFSLQDEDATGAEEWKLAASVPVDYKGLGIELSPEADVAIAKEDRTIGIYFRVVEGKTHVRLRLVVPLKPANIDQSISVLTVWNALIAEFPLWHTFHPIVAGNGPVELTPQSPYYNLIHVLLKVFWLKPAQVQEVHTMFNFDSGVELLSLEDLPPGAPVKAQHPPPQGFVLTEDVIKTFNLIIPQRHTCFFNTTIVMDFKKPPPQWIMSWFLSWVMPEIVRRMFKTGVKSVLSRDAPHMTAIQKDASGLYSVISRLVDNAAEREAQVSSAPYSPRNPPCAEVIAARARSLIKYEESGPPGRDHILSGPPGNDHHIISL